MKTRLICLPFFLFFTGYLTGQDTTGYQPPANLRNASDNLPNQVDLFWTPPPGWTPSPVDRWYDYDQGIYGGDAFGSCPGCPVEIAIRWDSAYFDFYDSVYISKIRYVLREASLEHALRVYQVSDNIFDTLLNHPLEENLVFYAFDTLEFDPIPINISKELWVSLWISDLGPGFPMAVTWYPDVVDGYSNLIKIYDQGYWETFKDIGYESSWNMGAFLETPNDSVIYPIFNLYRSLDNMPYEKINAGNLYDTVFHNYIQDLDANSVSYYVTCVYEDGESIPSDTLQISLVKTSEFIQNKNIKIFPNPATDHVSIESAKGKINLLSLIDSRGSTVLEKIVGDERIDLDISGMNSSIYIIKIITEEGMFASKLLVVR